MKLPVLYIVTPCYNEEKVLPITAPMFLEKIQLLISLGKISSESKVMFVNDGSKDSTWQVICDLAESDSYYVGITLSRNRGHQNALLAGLMEAKDLCDITVSVDCDGQDDINVIENMVDDYLSGSEVVYGVRKARTTDTFFKKNTAQTFYKILAKLGAETVYNHADYRLVSSRVLQEFANFKEVNLFLRGLIPLVGFKSSCVYYDRFERIAGETHYPLTKMLALAFDGITSLSIKPIRLITASGFIVSMIAFIVLIFSMVQYFMSNTISGWTSTIIAIVFFSGIQLISIGVIGEYIGKIYLEVKQRPRYIISEKTY